VAKLIEPLINAGHSQIGYKAASDPQEQSFHPLSSPKAIMHDQDA
jgi:hypothetical protein